VARRVVESLIKNGKVIRGYLGVILDRRPIDTTAARKLSLPNNKGALILEVQPGSPAEQAGLKSNDVIVKLADHDVVDPAGLRNLTAGLDAGTEVPLTYYRDGKVQTSSVTIAELPPAPEVLSLLGLNIREHSADKNGGGTVLEVDRVVSGGPAFREGLRPGMRILAVGEKPEPVSTLSEFETAVRKLDLRRGVPMVIQTLDGRTGPVRLGTARVQNGP